MLTDVQNLLVVKNWEVYDGYSHPFRIPYTPLTYFHVHTNIILNMLSPLINLQLCPSFTFVQLTYTFVLLSLSAYFLLLTYFHFCPTSTYILLSLLSRFIICPTFTFFLLSLLSNFLFWPTFTFDLLSISTRSFSY